MGDIAEAERPLRWNGAASRRIERLGAPQEDATMAGIIRAHIVSHHDQSIDVTPIDCPAADAHTNGTLRCTTIMFDGERRSCRYWQACTFPSNDTHRADPSKLA